MLDIAFRWWLRVFQCTIVEEHEWSLPSSPPAHLYVDARGVPPRCAAVLVMDGRTSYTDGRPAQELVQRFVARDDNQIASLEMLAITVGLSTFAPELANRRVVAFSDNTVAEVWRSAVAIGAYWTCTPFAGLSEKRHRDRD